MAKSTLDMTTDELIGEGYTSTQISDIRRRAFEEKATLGTLIASGAMIGWRLGGPLGAIAGGVVGGGINWLRKQSFIVK